MDVGLPLLHGDEGGLELPPAEPFPATAAGKTMPSREESEHATAEVTQAQARRPRGPKSIPADRSLEIRSSELLTWNRDYVTIMANASHQKSQHRSSHQAKKNAAYWVFGRGIGGISNLSGTSAIPNPLRAFAGTALQEALLGPTSPEKRKRTRSPSPVRTPSSERRTRARIDEGSQLGRGQAAPGADEPLLPLFDDDHDIELGRNQGATLQDDRSSLMPWNLSSRPGSVQRTQQQQR